MLLRTTTITGTSDVNHVPGVFAVSPIIRGDAVRMGRSHSGTPGLVQGGRIIAVGEPATLLTFAARNKLLMGESNQAQHQYSVEKPIKTFEIS